MISSQKTLLNQLSENSESTIKRDLHRALAGLEVRQENLRRLNAPACDDRYRGAGALGIIDESIERLERMRYTGHDVTLSVDVAEPFKDFTVGVGIRNDPKAPPAGAGGASRMLDVMLANLASMGYSKSDVIVIGHGGRLFGGGHFDYSIFDECHAVPRAEAVDELSEHPGERHRQLSRKLTSSRSRAGKAARWAS